MAEKYIIKTSDRVFRDRNDKIFKELEKQGFKFAHYQSNSKVLYINYETMEYKMYGIFPRSTSYEEVSLDFIEFKLGIRKIKGTLGIPKIFKENEVKEKMINEPVTQLEKKACASAVELAVKNALEKKQEGYNLLMEDYIKEEGNLISLKEDLNKRRKAQKEIETKLKITSAMKKDLF